MNLPRFLHGTSKNTMLHDQNNVILWYLFVVVLNMYHYSILGSTIEYNVNANVIHLLKVPCLYFINCLHIPCYYPGFLGSTV